MKSITNPTSGSVACSLSEDTRVVTPSGFRRHGDLISGEPVLSCDLIGRRQWLPVIKVVACNYVGDVVHMWGQKFDLLQGVDSEVPLRDRKDETTISMKINSMTDNSSLRRRRVTTSAANNEPDLIGIDDDMIALMGWCLSDGGVSPRGYWTLYQRMSNANSIRGILNRLRMPYTEAVRYRDIKHVMGRGLIGCPEPSVEFRVKAAGCRAMPFRSKKELPRWAFRMSERQFEIFWASIVDGDGSYATSGVLDERGRHTSGVLYSNCDSLRMELQILLIMNGYGTSISVFNGNDHRLNFHKSTTNGLHSRTKMTIEPYVGHLWGLDVPGGRYFVERKGKVYLAGVSVT